MTLEEVLQKIYDKEVNVCIEWVWDSGFDISICQGFTDGVKKNGKYIESPEAIWSTVTVESISEIKYALIELFNEDYPESKIGK